MRSEEIGNKRQSKVSKEHGLLITEQQEEQKKGIYEIIEQGCSTNLTVLMCPSGLDEVVLKRQWYPPCDVSKYDVMQPINIMRVTVTELKRSGQDGFPNCTGPIIGGGLGGMAGHTTATPKIGTTLGQRTGVVDRTRENSQQRGSRFMIGKNVVRERRIFLDRYED